jgi:dihydrofolate reductase
LLQGDGAEAVAGLKDDDGDDLHVVGSTQLVEHDLVDGYRLMIDPLTLGGGKGIFRPDGVFRALRLVESQVTSTGAIPVTYARADG